MLRISQALLNRAKKKALQSSCRYKISALGFDIKNRLIYSSTNIPRFSKQNGSIHAEMKLMLKSDPSLKYIIIFRMGKRGLLPIHPCAKCSQKAIDLGIKIYSLEI